MVGVLLALQTTAQTVDAPFNISAGIGTASLGNTMVSNFNIFDPAITVKTEEYIGYSLHFDYAMGSVISFGGSFNFNKASLVLNENLANQTTYNGTGVAIGARMLFHLLGRKTKAIDPYLGTGFSLLIWSYESPEVILANNNGNQLNAIVPFTFGCRYYINDHFGVGTEFSTNRTSRINLGLNFKF